MTNNSTHTNCLICNSAELKALKKFSKAALIQCKQCSFIFCKNRPSDQHLQNYYGDSYERTKYFSPITRTRYNELLDAFEEHRSSNKILDVGCGYGFFLEVAKERGWEVYGTELSDEAIAVCQTKGIKTFKGKIIDNSYSDEDFDVITSFEMIEHINYPIEYTEQIKRLLKPGGRAYVTTPNFNAVLRYRLKEAYNIIGYPNHLTYFTKNTLQSLFEQHGFETLKIQTTGYSVTRKKTSQGKSNQDYVSETSDDEMLRYKIENSVLLKAGKHTANWALNKLKIGDSIKATFIKSNSKK